MTITADRGDTESGFPERPDEDQLINSGFYSVYARSARDRPGGNNPARSCIAITFGVLAQVRIWQHLGGHLSFLCYGCDCWIRSISTEIIFLPVGFEPGRPMIRKIIEELQHLRSPDDNRSFVGI